jgi:hypothetical protein
LQLTVVCYGELSNKFLGKRVNGKGEREKNSFPLLPLTFSLKRAKGNESKRQHELLAVLPLAQKQCRFEHHRTKKAIALEYQFQPHFPHVMTQG